MVEVPRIGVAAVLALVLGCVSRLSSAQESRTFEYQAMIEWADSGILLLPGDRIYIDTQASWANSAPAEALFNARGFPGGATYPGTYQPNLPLGMALVRVGDAIWPAIDRSVDVRQTGQLRFAMNDVPGNYADNTGSARVVMRLLLRPALMADFRGRPLVDAQKFLARWGIEPEIMAGQSRLAPGLIFEQEPLPGVDLHEVSRVIIHIADASPPPVEVPDVVGLSASEGAMRLQEIGLVPEAQDAQLSPLAMDTILRTEPNAGASVRSGTRVRYWPASGENILPDVVGYSTVDARRVLDESGFVVLELARPLFGTAGAVAAQVPMAGVAVRLDSQIVPTLAGGFTTLLLQGVLIAGGLVAAAQLLRHWRRHAYTAGIHMQATMAGDSPDSSSDTRPEASMAMRCSLTQGATEFPEPPSVLKAETRNA